MDFAHEQSWNALISILALKLTADEAWSKFIDFHEQVAPKPYWTQLRQMDVPAEQSEILAWIQQLLNANPLPNTVVAIWIGIFKSANNDKEIPTVYFSGADTYSKDDIDWACDPNYLPDDRYIQPSILHRIDEILIVDKRNYEFFDWIFPLAYCAFTFDEIFRSKINKKLLLASRSEIYVTVGHDSGDYVELTVVH